MIQDVVEGVPDSHEDVDENESKIKISVELVETLGDALPEVAEAKGEPGSDTEEAASVEIDEAVGEPLHEAEAEISGEDTVEVNEDAVDEAVKEIEAIEDPEEVAEEFQEQDEEALDYHEDKKISS